MADSESSGSVGAVAIVAILVLVLAVGFFLFKGGILSGGSSAPSSVNVKVQAPSSQPAAPAAPASGGGDKK